MKLKLHWQILIAIILAMLIGAMIDKDTAIGSVTFYSIFSFIGTLFLNALKMIIVPLVLSSIICGISSIGASENLGRLGSKTIGFYLLSSLLAILIGLIFVNVLTPGIVDGKPAGEILNLSTDTEVASQLERVEDRSASDITDVFLRMVPTNIVKAAAEGQMLGLIFFGMLFGYFMSQLAGQQKQALENFWQGVFNTMMAITMFVMKFAPIGVFGLVAKTITATGFSAFQPLLLFFITVLLALLFHKFITLALLLKTVVKINPLSHYTTMAPAMLTAFSTASSSGTLPITMECIEKRQAYQTRQLLSYYR